MNQFHTLKTGTKETTKHCSFTMKEHTKPVTGADPGKMKGGASKKGQSPVRGWQSHPGGGAPPPAALPEATFFSFYNLLTI